MTTCDLCGNHEGRFFTITMGGTTGTFDSFECAIQVMAPACEHCGCRILGHPAETESGVYCCAHCARESGNPHRPAKMESSGVAVKAPDTPGSNPGE